MIAISWVYKVPAIRLMIYMITRIASKLKDASGSRSPVAGLESILHNGDDVLHEDRRAWS